MFIIETFLGNSGVMSKCVGIVCKLFHMTNGKVLALLTNVYYL